MTFSEHDDRVLYLPDGLRFDSGRDTWGVQTTTARPSEWHALVPGGQEPMMDPAGPLSRILATLKAPVIGTVELFGKNIYRIDYGVRQRLRARLGFVHGYGGLLSNRTIRENIALPVSVHGHMGEGEENETVDRTLEIFGLSEAADLFPHQVDGGSRWIVCLARALVLKPDWLVLEGIGNWEMDRGRGIAWRTLMGLQQTSRMAVMICLPRHNPGFEEWFESHGGEIHHYPRIEDRG